MNLLPSQQALDFVVVTGSSLLAALTCRKIENPVTRRLLLGGVGFITAIYYSGLQFLYVLLLILLTSSIAMTKYHPNVVLVIAFVLRILSNILAIQFKSWDDDNTITGSLLMITTLKAVGVSYEVHTYYFAKQETHSTNRKVLSKPLEHEPKYVDILLYLFCCCGQFTGPYYTFKTYYEGTSIPNKVYSKTHWKQYSCKIFLHCLIAITVHLIGRQYVGLHLLGTEGFKTMSLPTRILQVVLTSQNGGLFLISSWLGAECVCVVAGIGAYPKEMKSKSGQGPTAHFNTSEDTSDWDFETITNMRCWKHYACCRASEALKEWNSCTQWWLVRHCYIADFIPQKDKMLRLFFTMTISAMWHGLKPGFYILFWTSSFVTISERICDNLRTGLSDVWKMSLDFFMFICFRWIVIPFAGLGLLLQEFEPIYEVYKSCYFLHIISIVMIPLVLTICSQFQPKPNIKSKIT
ncbi:membrane-bound acylglycerophosphatidylinositol O-acyltransferase mboat7-like isoform X1 [Styela clava]